MPLRSSELALVASVAYTHLDSTRFDDKVFPAWVVHVTTSGRWTLHGRNGVEQIRAGDVVSGHAGERFGCRHDASNPNRGLVAALFNEAIDETVVRLFDRQVLAMPNVAAGLQRATLCLDDEDFDSQVFELFHAVSKRSLSDDKYLRRTDVRMQRVKRFIERNALENLRLEDIASAVGLNPFACVRQFKHSTGMTPYAYLIEQRMVVAKQLLRNGTDSISRIARRTGFKDPAYFSRSFKRTTGVTPTEFRLAVTRS